MCKSDQDCPRGQICVRGVCAATARRPPLRWLWSLACLLLVAATPDDDRQANFAKNSRAAICADECDSQSAVATSAESQCLVATTECKSSCDAVVAACKDRYDQALTRDNEVCESSPSYATMQDAEIDAAILSCKTAARSRHGAGCAGCDRQATSCGTIECVQSASMCREASRSRAQARAKCAECK